MLSTSYEIIKLDFQKVTLLRESRSDTKKARLWDVDPEEWEVKKICGRI